MKAKRESREERNDVIGFYVDKEVIGINGTVTVEEQIEVTTKWELMMAKEVAEAALLAVTEKLALVAELESTEA